MPGSDDGFTDAFDRYSPAILRFAQRRLGQREVAWDVVSDTFISAWRHWDRRPVNDQQVLPWLYAIAANSVRDQRRSDVRRLRLVTRLSSVRAERHTADPADGVVLGKAVSDAPARLPEADREVLWLIVLEGETDARSIGIALGLTPGGAPSRVHRARRRLRKLHDDADHPAAEPAADNSARQLHQTPVPRQAVEV